MATRYRSFCADNMRTAGGAAREDARFDSSVGAIGLGQLLRNLFDFGGFDERNRAAAESAAGHSRTEDAARGADVAGQVDEQIQLGAAYFVVVAQRVVAGVHELTDL